MYLETYWLRKIIAEDVELTRRVSHLFAYNASAPQESDERLPPRDHLLNWAREIQDRHLMVLANVESRSGISPSIDDWLPKYLVQVHARTSERMLAAITARTVSGFRDNYQVRKVLEPHPPIVDAVPVYQGHYRIGAREGVVFDNETPAQIVELSSFRIAARPVSNAEYLAFMLDGGYSASALWTKAGLRWRQSTDVANHPWHWRQDAAGHWYDINFNGAADLPAGEAVMGINRHEAQAYANWAAQSGREHTGAVLQHEYQWETAARSGLLKYTGRVWEWCASNFWPYDGYQKPNDPELVTLDFDGGHASLRGGCLHTQAALRRANLRHHADPACRCLFSGVRLVYPPN